MSKMKVYELAKELGKSSKELLEFLGERNIEVKSHMSSIEDKEISLVKKAFGGKSEAVNAKKPSEAVGKAESEKRPEETQKEENASKTEAAVPKKKNIVRVFRPQNTRDGGKGGNRPGGRQMGGGRPATGARPMQNARPMQVQNGRPAPGSRPAPNVRPV